MRWRLTQNDVTNRVDVEDPLAVNAEVVRIFEQRYPDASFALLNRVFDDFKRLFIGEAPGYLVCDTPYHDLRHTLDMTLAIARLIDGHDRTHAEVDRLGAQRALIGVITALFHDSGYIRKTSEGNIQGASLTRIHVSRSASMLRDYLPRIGLGDAVPVAATIVHFTGYEVALDQIEIDNPLDRKLGHMLGTADLIGQMSDRTYLEKCRDYLYQEFVLAGIARVKLADGNEKINYASPEDLLAKTPGFHDDVAMKRMDDYFDKVYRYAAAHFDGENHYLREISLNMDYLKALLETDNQNALHRKNISLSGDWFKAHHSSP